MPFGSERLLNALYGTLADPVFVSDMGRTILSVNPAVRDIFGYEPAELVGVNAVSLYAHPAQANKIGLWITGDGLDMRHRTRAEFRRKDGSVFEADLVISRVVDDGGKPIGHVVVVHDLTDVLAAQASQLQTAHILREALSSITEGFVVYDADDRLVMCNDAYLEIYPLSAPAITVGASFESILRFGMAKGQYPQAGTEKKSQEAWIQERLSRHKKPGPPIIQQAGPNRWVQIEERITSENYRVGIRTDITRLLEVKSEAERLGQILEGIKQECFVFDGRTLKFTFANSSARENMQYSIDELQVMTPFMVQPGSSEAQFRALLAPLDQGKRKFIEFRGEHRRKDGSAYPCSTKVELLEFSPGSAYIAFVEDIAEKIEIESQLARKQMEFESLVRNLPDAITRAAPDTTLTYVNEIYADFLGMKPEEIIGRKFMDLVLESERGALQASIKGLSPQAPITVSEQEIVSGDGQTHRFLWSNLMTYKDGKPVEIFSVGRDITEQHRARIQIAAQSRELAQRNDALEQFAGIVSHDLKAPIRHIRLFSEMIAEDLAAGRLEDLTQFCAQISESGRRMDRMISSLLEFSQLAYRLVSPRGFRLSDALHEAWDNLGAIAYETQAVIEIDADIDLTGDYELIVRLFQNLIANSLKYQPDGSKPKVKIVAESDGKMIWVGVEDNGIGVPPAHAEGIFGIFQRLHRDEKTYGGSGIGLALCRRVAESHGGSIRLDTSYTGGARFVVMLPADEPKSGS